MSRSAEAWRALATAMIDTAPACQGDDRFTDDDQATAELAPICRACPLYDLCATYAELDRPTGGIWAGRGPRRNNTKANKTEWGTL